jgi:O-antigen/teichoic acid export membrane protein
MFLEVHEYGQINYVIAIGSLSSSISLLGLNTAVTTLVPQGHKQIDIQANQVILVSATVCAIIASIFLYLVLHISRLYHILVKDLIK